MYKLNLSFMDDLFWALNHNHIMTSFRDTFETRLDKFRYFIGHGSNTYHQKYEFSVRSPNTLKKNIPLAQIQT